MSVDFNTLLLGNKKLKFLAFNGLSPHVQSKFRNTYSDTNAKFTLELWNKFELIYPKTFANMYNFWVEKK